jgi:hypothetical protein
MMTLSTRAIISVVVLGVLLSSGFAPVSRGAEPLKLHPENPHYVVFRGKPTVLVASTEHYGAVLNRDFDFRPYLDELKAAGLNYTRIFSGVYSEGWGGPFNTLNPPGGRLLAPWARGATPGYADGGNRFDLETWDDAYFRRLREFIVEAGRRGVVVELTLFCNWYDDNQWRLSPLYARNNAGGVGDRDSKQVNSLRGGDVLRHQEAMVRKVVAEVNDLDNVFFEVCNEPGAEGDWMDRMAGIIWEAEGKLPNRHLIANNGHPVPHMAIFNAHYDRDCSFVRDNYGRNIVVGFDETGFDGAGDLPYRRQGWNFLVSGGGLYDNLDWSFSVAHPDGTETKWDKKLGGGGPALRRQLGILRAFLEGFDLPKLKPENGVVKGGAPGSFRVLAERGRQYAVYLDGGSRAELRVDLPAGDYAAQWIDTKTGEKVKAEDVSGGGVRTLKSTEYAEDIALRILRKGFAPRGGD